MYFSIEQFSNALRLDGVPGALKYLNRGVDHRYTSISRLDGLDFVNAGLYDKAGQQIPATFSYTPVHASFCQFVLRDGAFRTNDSSLDTRLAGHPYQGVMMAYHGVPVKNAQGDLYGTLCHFDLVQRPLPDAEFELLQQAATLLAPYLARENTP